MGRFRKMTSNLAERIKTKKTDGAHGGGFHVSPTAGSNASDPSEISTMANYAQPSDGPAGTPDKLSKPASVASNATPVTSLFETPSLQTSNMGPHQQPENVIHGPSSSTTLASLSDADDLWALAYRRLEDQEPKLVKDYQDHLSLVDHNNPVPTNLSDPRSVELVIKQLLEDREQKQWKFSLLGKEVKIREQTEKLAKFLLWVDPVMKDAVGTQPYAALAWAGVSLLLPVGQGIPLSSS
jgi:hypothetical protein